MKFNIKHFVLIFTLLVTSIFLSACNSNGSEQQGYKLPDLTGKTITNYKELLNSPTITIVERKENHNTIPTDQFIKYGESLTAGSEVQVGKVVYVYFSIGPKEQVIVDTEAPQIVGANDLSLPFASDFDPKQGITVVDNVDTDLLSRLIVSGTVNTYQFTDEPQTVTYTVMDKSGNLTQVVRKITIVPNEIDTRFTDHLKLEAGYVGKGFIRDGIGVVTLISATDGDTARFKDSVTGEEFSLRFLGINTPESTPLGGYEPWGKAASLFTKNILENAKTIVLEAEGPRTEGYGRYLGWVWVDGRLLNLELIENAYSRLEGSSSSKYYETLFNAEVKASGSKKRVWGEIDPDYDYVNSRFK